MKRQDLVRAMDLIARSLNDEELIEQWLIYGVADGDIDEDTTDEYLEMYCSKDEDFAELIDLFTNLMKESRASGGIYFDGIVSGEDE